MKLRRPGPEAPGEAHAIWYVSRGDKKAGPLSWGQLQTMAGCGGLLPGDLLWRRGMPQAVPAASLAGPPAALPVPGRRHHWKGKVAAAVVILAAGLGVVLAYVGRTQAQFVRAPAASIAPARAAEPAKGPGTRDEGRGVGARLPRPYYTPAPPTPRPSPLAPRPSPLPVVPAGARLDTGALAQLIDQHIQAKLDADSVPPSPPADDAEFVRRVYLDLVGVIPPPEKAAAFLDNRQPDKRARLIDELLADPRYGRFQAEIWSGALVPADSNNRKLKAGPLQTWFTTAFNKNRPWDQVVQDLVTASGRQEDNGAVTLFLANPTPDKVTDAVSRVFLGVQLQCAQCHNHPFTSWKREEYWGMAAFFTKVQSGKVNKAAKQGTSPSVTEGAVRKKGKAVPAGLAVAPKFLQGQQPKLRADEPYRPVLAHWMVAPQNPFLARALVNKTWAHFFGRGFVNPVDDMIEEHAASHPELLEALADQFKANGFDVKYLMRAICNSKTYQRTSRPLAGNKEDNELFSHVPVRVLAPGQLFDSLAVVLGPAEEGQRVKGKKAAGKKKGNVSVRDRFLAFFHVGDDSNPLEYQAGIPQALLLMNARQINASAGAITRALKAGGGSPRGVLDHLYLAALSRRPTVEERQRLNDYLRRQGDARTGYGDILWALLNSSEFSLTH